MKPDTMRWIDRNIGRVLCLFLTLLRRFGDIFISNAGSRDKPSRILFVKLIEQGSTVLAYPALKKAAAIAGRDNVYFLVFKENRGIIDILDVMPRSNVFEIDTRDILSFIFSGIKAIISIRLKKIDCAIDMEFFLRGSAILSYLSGARKRVGLHLFACEGPYRGDLFTHRLVYNPYLSMRLFFLSLVEALIHEPPQGVAPMTFEVPRVPDEIPRFIPSKEAKRALIAKIEAQSGSALGKPVVILNPKLNDLIPRRRWPEENFVRLGDLIADAFPRSTIVISGDAAEKDAAERLAGRIRRAVSLAGRTSLEELLTLYHIADLLVTSDSGPAHFSTLTPIRSFILYGPETPLLYGPIGEGARTISSPMVCSPCLNAYNHRKTLCSSGMCLRNISAEDVFERIKAVV